MIWGQVFESCVREYLMDSVSIFTSLLGILSVLVFVAGGHFIKESDGD